MTALTRSVSESARSTYRQRLAALVTRAPLVATVVLGLAVIAQAANIALDLLSGMAIGVPARPAPARTRMISAGGTTAVAAITHAHLFGSAPIETAATSSVVSRAPLVLTGIIATGDPKDGFAILGSSAATARVFHAGSEAAPGVMLAEVYPQWVVVLRGGERETLRLPRASGGKQVISVMFARSGPARSGVADDGQEGVPLPSPSDFKPPPRSTANTLIRAFSLRPVSIGGERGVRIMGTGINSTTLSALGLAPGDVIMQINGVPVGNRNTPDLGRALSTGGVTLVVNRDGGETSVSIDASSAANAANAYREAAPDL
jgi:type II secretory pathway component PulC